MMEKELLASSTATKKELKEIADKIQGDIDSISEEVITLPEDDSSRVMDHLYA
jgi:TPP-dependent pyruvate/acetoin dehydrogenase alpha subunit